MGEPFGGPTPQLVYGQLGAESRVYVLRDGIHVGDTSGNDRVHVGQLPSGDYGLEVTNPGGTVIIDGTSNMFKIQATGTISNTVAKGGVGWTDVTVTGPFSATPAHLSFVSSTNLNTGERAIGRLITWGVPVPTDFAMQAHMDVTTTLTGTDARVRFGGQNSNNAAGAITWFCRFYVLKEAAL